jgi:ferredoxin
LPDKAIHLELSQVSRGDGNLATVQLPHVNRDLCIGCGICEYRCPVNGEAAIRVYVPNSGPVF